MNIISEYALVTAVRAIVGFAIGVMIAAITAVFFVRAACASDGLVYERGIVCTTFLEHGPTTMPRWDTTICKEYVAGKVVRRWSWVDYREYET